MMKVFLDTNVALDFLMHRDGFFEEARAVIEDAMQYFSARSIFADCIVTRNVKDFPFSDISIMTPHEFLQKMNVTL